METKSIGILSRLYTRAESSNIEHIFKLVDDKLRKSAYTEVVVPLNIVGQNIGRLVLLQIPASMKD